MSAFTARLDQGDGTDVRHLRWGGEEIAARLYFAIRDDRWRTVPLEVVERRLDERPDGFLLRVRGRSSSPDMPLDVEIDFAASGQRLAATFRGRARDGFDYNRIGFCLLLPLSHAGRPLELVQASGAVVSDRLPLEIAPQEYVDGAPQPLFGAAFSALSVALGSGARLDARFSGDEFEIEDQRNWSDASFKAYGTPLSLGFPHRATAGQPFEQTVELTVSAAGSPASFADEPVTVGTAVGVLPRIALYAPGEPPGTWRPEAGFPDLNRTRPPLAALGDVRAVALGINCSVHADDRWSIAETATVHGAIARQVRALYPTLALRLRPLDFGTPAGNWMKADGRYTHTPAPGIDHPLRREPFAAAWLVTSLGSIAGVDAEVIEVGDPGLAETPLGRLVAELAERAGDVVHRVTSPPGVGALAVADAAGTVTLYLANADSRSRRVAVAGRDAIELGPDTVVRLTVDPQEDA